MSLKLVSGRMQVPKGFSKNENERWTTFVRIDISVTVEVSSKIKRLSD